VIPVRGAGPWRSVAGRSDARVAIPLIVGVLLAGAGALAGTASAQPARAPEVAPDREPEVAPEAAPDREPDIGPAPSAVRVTSLDGIYLALGPVAAFVRADGPDGPDGKWDGGFGGEISLVRVRERDLLASLGITAGALRLAAADRGRLWSEVLAGTRLAGIHAGLGAGASVDIDEVRAPRWGGHGMVWIFAGVVPYARVGVVEESGLLVEIGVKVALPVMDW
jgi:hypothetical protein